MNQRIHKELHLHHCKSPDPDPCQPHLWNSSITKSTIIKSLACNGCETKKNMRASWGFEQVISDLAFENWPEFEGYIVHLQNILQFTHHFVCLFFFFLSWAWIAPVDFTIPLLSVLVHLEESLLVLLSHVWWALQVHLGTEGNKSTLSWIMLRNNKRDSFLLSQKLTQL